MPEHPRYLSLFTRNATAGRHYSGGIASRACPTKITDDLPLPGDPGQGVVGSLALAPGSRVVSAPATTINDGDGRAAGFTAPNFSVGSRQDPRGSGRDLS